MHHAAFTIAAILTLGIACQWLAWRVRIPAILPLLVAGFVAGPVTGLLDPEALLGELLFPVVSLSVALILFEGALTLQWREIRTVAGSVRNLITIGTVVTWVGTALAGRYLIGLPWSLATLLGAVLVVTGPTVIGPLLRNVRPAQPVASILKWEGILIDPIGALLAVLVFELIVAEVPLGELGGQALLTFLRTVGVGVATGVVAGALVGLALRGRAFPDYLRDIAVLASVFLAFALSDLLAAESGLLAVTVMGVLLANVALPGLPEILNFKEKLSVLLISGLFVLLAASVGRSDIALLDLRSLALLAVVMFVIRPLSVAICCYGSALNWRQKVFLGWVAPRGIVAAAVSALFAFRLEALGYDEARLLVPLTFLVIVGTVLVQGATAKPLARRLGISAPEPTGVLFMGAHPLVQMLGLALQREGIPVQLVDYDWSNVRQARMSGLPAQYARLLSGTLDEDVDTTETAVLVAMSSNDEANALACVQFSDDLGSSHVFQLAPQRLEAVESFIRLPMGRILFGKEWTYHRLKARMDDGGVVKTTPLTSEFTFEDYLEKRDTVPMFAVKGSRVEPFAADRQPRPRPGWSVIGVVCPETPQEADSPFVVSETSARRPEDVRG